MNVEAFKAYLKGRRFKETTMEEHCRNLQHFMNWLKQENYEYSAIRYSDLLAYINYEKLRNIAPATINLRLSSVSYYFEHLKEQGIITKNPARTIRVKGVISTVIKDPLSQSELEMLYQQYSQLKRVGHRQQQIELVHQRNTVIVGLLVFQGVHSGELQKMEVGHINLQVGTVYIPSTSQGESRELPLSSKQIIGLHQYLTSTREILRPKGEELIAGSVRNIMVPLMEEIQGLNPLITNAQHIRGSVILNWLKIHHKRQVQYMAGHKYISSTEKYASQELDDLQDALAKYHPFG